MSNIFDIMLDSNKYFVQNAKHVKIDLGKLDEFARSIDIKENAHWLNDLPFEIYSLTIEEIINFLLIYHAMGFSYWADIKWGITYGSNVYDGSIGLICAIMREIKSNKDFLNFEYLSRLPFKEFQRILSGNVQLPLLKERYDNLIEVSRVVCEKMNSNFYEYIKDINNDIELFDIIIRNFKSYEDVSQYNNRKVYYYKRAQLLVSDILHIKSERLKQEVCYTNLIGCADYKIPQVLEGLGITIYDAELADLIDNKEAIEKDSIYEMEIRSTLLVIVDYIKKVNSNKYSAIDINDYIWMKGQGGKYNKRPYHRTRTTAY